MFNRLLAPCLAIASLSLLGCRPEPRGGELPSAGDEPLIADDSADGSIEADPPKRPPGAIFRSEVRRATQDGSAAYLLGQLRPEPYRPQGRFEGWIITALWPGDPDLCAPGCDLRIGDVILSVNGSKLDRPEDLAEAMTKLETLESLDLRGLRDGQYFERSHPILP